MSPGVRRMEGVEWDVGFLSECCLVECECYKWDSWVVALDDEWERKTRRR